MYGKRTDVTTALIGHQLADQNNSVNDLTIN